jgi:hypothetical protein
VKLFLLNPQPAFKARVNQTSFTFPLTELTFDTVTLGTFSAIYPNMTVFIGSTEGASDLGVTRVRKLATSTKLHIGLAAQGDRYGEINPVDNAYITVFYDWRVWPKIPRIDPDGVRYMDADLDWATYGQFSPPVANAGSGFAGTIDSGSGKITVDFSAANSFTTHPGATIASYGWSVHDGVIVSGTSTSSTITATFPAGFRWVTLGVADSNSQFHYCHVPVLAIDPANDPCINNFQIERHVIRPSGQEMSVRVRQAIPATTYPENTLALVIDGEPSGPTDRSNLTFIGWAEQEPTNINAGETATLADVTLALTDVVGRLKSLPGFSQIIEHTATPAKWGEMNSPNMNRYVHALLQWQTTALDLADYTPAPTGGSYTFKILGSDGASLFEQVNRRAQALIPDHLLTCDTLGRLRVLPDPLLQAAGDRTSTVQTTLDADDYRSVDYTRQRHPRVHWLRSNAILSSTSAVDTAFCIAPGTAPGWGENAQDDGEHLALSQSDLNVVTGHRYARLNAANGLLRVALAAGSRQGIEPAYLTWVQLTIPTSVAAQRGLTLTNARCLPQEVTIRYQHERTGLVRSVEVTLEQETSGATATTVTVTPADPVDTGDWNTAPAEDPPFDYGLDGGDTLAAITKNGFIYRTSNFLAATPTWVTNTAAAGALGTLNLHGWVVDPFSPGYRGTGSAINAYAISNQTIWRLNDIFGTPSYTNLYTFSQNISSGGESGAIAASFGRFFPDEADNPWIMAVQSRFTTGASDNGVYLVYSTDAGATWSSEIRPSTFTQTVSTNQGVARPAVYLSPKTPGLAYVGSYSASGTTPTGAMYRSTDWGATWSLVTDLSISQGDGLGHCYHVPWPTNASEQILYHAYRDRTSSQFKYRLRRVSGGSAADISPLDGGKRFGPVRNGFGVRTHDNDRRYVLLAGIGNDTNTVEPGTSGSAPLAAAFLSEDYGDTWTRLTTPVVTNTNTGFAYQGAFGASSPDILYLWGNDGYLAYSGDRGVTIASKIPTGATTEILGICGGPYA